MLHSNKSSMLSISLIEIFSKSILCSSINSFEILISCLLILEMFFFNGIQMFFDETPQKTFIIIWVFNNY